MDGGNGWRLTGTAGDDAGPIVVIDDSVMTGNSLTHVGPLVQSVFPSSKLLLAAVYVDPLARKKPDLWAADRPLQKATRQIMQAFGLKWQTINILADPVESYSYRVDLLLVFAGGSMGGWRPARLLRQRAQETGIPWVLLPQTFLDYEEGNYERVYVRETASLRYCPHAHMAPDLALGYDFHETQRPSKGKGLFLRKDLSSLRTAENPLPASTGAARGEDAS